MPDPSTEEVQLFVPPHGFLDRLPTVRGGHVGGDDVYAAVSPGCRSHQFAVIASRSDHVKTDVGEAMDNRGADVA